MPHFNVITHVTGEDFFNREKELAKMFTIIDDMRQKGINDWLAILGNRRVGKTSLELEFKRRVDQKYDDVCVVFLDCRKNFSTWYDVYVGMILKTIDEYLWKRGYLDKGKSFWISYSVDYQAYLEQKQTLKEIEFPGKDLILRELRTQEEWQQYIERGIYLTAMDFPYELALETQTYFQFIYDEFQDLVRFNDPPPKKGMKWNIFETMRGAWQMHKKWCNYHVSGSKLHMLANVIFDYNQPFAGHFTPMWLWGFEEEKAEDMLHTLLESEGKKLINGRGEEIPPEERIENRLITLSAGNPFCIQSVGKMMCAVADEAGTDEIDRAIYEEAVNRDFFDSAGRIYTFCHYSWNTFLAEHPQKIYQRILLLISQGVNRIDDISSAVSLSKEEVDSLLEELMEFRMIARDKILKTYHLFDPMLGHWLAGTKTIIENVAGPYIIGVRREQELARWLLHQGYTIVYHSYASRGAFDLLLYKDGKPVGIQLKSVKKFPYYFPRSEYRKMEAYSQKLSSGAMLCLYYQNGFRFYPLEELVLEKGEFYRVDEETSYKTHPF
ncbi:MAG: hypothetical protein ONB05_03745 [candidate division KSB1 bacterium]|nr:hypothetical protein [candidate division KSB1 bacterium]